MPKKTNDELKLKSKSIQFPAPMLEDLGGLAIQVGFTHISDGVKVGNIARIVLELVEFALTRKTEYLKWKMNGKK